MKPHVRSQDAVSPLITYLFGVVGVKIWLWGFEVGKKPPFALLLSVQYTKCDASLQGSDSLLVGKGDTK